MTVYSSPSPLPENTGFRLGPDGSPWPHPGRAEGQAQDEGKDVSFSKATGWGVGVGVGERPSVQFWKSQSVGLVRSFSRTGLQQLRVWTRQCPLAVPTGTKKQPRVHFLCLQPNLQQHRWGWLLLPLPYLAFISEAGGLEPGPWSKKVSLGREVPRQSRGGSGLDNGRSPGLHALEGPMLGVALC